MNVRGVIVTATTTGIAAGLAVLIYAIGLENSWPVIIGYGWVTWWLIQQLDKQPT